MGSNEDFKRWIAPLTTERRKHNINNIFKKLKSAQKHHRLTECLNQLMHSTAVLLTRLPEHVIQRYTRTRLSTESDDGRTRLYRRPGPKSKTKQLKGPNFRNPNTSKICEDDKRGSKDSQTAQPALETLGVNESQEFKPADQRPKTPDLECPGPSGEPARRGSNGSQTSESGANTHEASRKTAPTQRVLESPKRRRGRPRKSSTTEICGSSRRESNDSQTPERSQKTSEVNCASQEEEQSNPSNKLSGLETPATSDKSARKSTELQTCREGRRGSNGSQTSEPGANTQEASRKTAPTQRVLESHKRRRGRPRKSSTTEICGSSRRESNDSQTPQRSQKTSEVNCASQEEEQSNPSNKLSGLETPATSDKSARKPISNKRLGSSKRRSGDTPEGERSVETLEANRTSQESKLSDDKPSDSSLSVLESSRQSRARRRQSSASKPTNRGSRSGPNEPQTSKPSQDAPKASNDSQGEKQSSLRDKSPGLETLGTSESKSKRRESSTRDSKDLDTTVTDADTQVTKQSAPSDKKTVPDTPAADADAQETKQSAPSDKKTVPDTPAAVADRQETKESAPSLKKTVPDTPVPDADTQDINQSSPSDKKIVPDTPAADANTQDIKQSAPSNKKTVLDTSVADANTQDTKQSAPSDKKTVPDTPAAGADTQDTKQSAPSDKKTVPESPRRGRGRPRSCTTTKTNESSTRGSKGLDNQDICCESQEDKKSQQNDMTSGPACSTSRGDCARLEVKEPTDKSPSSQRKASSMELLTVKKQKPCEESFSLESQLAYEKATGVEFQDKKSFNIEIQGTSEKSLHLEKVKRHVFVESSSLARNGRSYSSSLSHELCERPLTLEIQEIRDKPAILEKQEQFEESSGMETIDPFEMSTSLKIQKACEKSLILESQEPNDVCAGENQFSTNTNDSGDKAKSNDCAESCGKEIQKPIYECNIPPSSQFTKNNLDNKIQLPDDPAIASNPFPEELELNDLVSAEEALQRLPTKTVPIKMNIPVLINKRVTVNTLIAGASTLEKTPLKDCGISIEYHEVLPKKNDAVKPALKNFMPFDRDKTEEIMPSSEEIVEVSDSSDHSAMSIDSDTFSDSEIDFLNADPSMANSFVSKKKNPPIRSYNNLDEKKDKIQADSLWLLKYKSNFFTEKLSCYCYYPEENRAYDSESWPEANESESGSDEQEEERFMESENEQMDSIGEPFSGSETSEPPNDVSYYLPSTSPMSCQDKISPSAEISTQKFAPKQSEDLITSSVEQLRSSTGVQGQLIVSPENTRWPPALLPIQTPFVPTTPPLPPLPPPVPPPPPSSPPPPLTTFPRRSTPKKHERKMENIKNTQILVEGGHNPRPKISFKVNSLKKDNFNKDLNSFDKCSDQIKFKKYQNELRLRNKLRNYSNKHLVPKQRKKKSPMKNNTNIQRRAISSSVKPQVSEMRKKNNSRNLIYKENDLISKEDSSIKNSHLSVPVSTENSIEKMYKYASKLEMAKQDWDLLFSKKLKENKTISESDYTDTTLLEIKTTVVSNSKKTSPQEIRRASINCNIEPKLTLENSTPQCNYDIVMIQNYTDSLMKKLQEANRSRKHTVETQIEPNYLLKSKKTLAFENNGSCNLQLDKNHKNISHLAEGTTHSSSEDKENINNKKQTNEHEDFKVSIENTRWPPALPPIQTPFVATNKAKESLDSRTNNITPDYSSAINLLLNLLPRTEKPVGPKPDPIIPTIMNSLVDYESSSETSENEQLLEDSRMVSTNSVSNSQINQTSKELHGSDKELPNLEIDLNSNIRYSVEFTGDSVELNKMIIGNDFRQNETKEILSPVTMKPSVESEKEVFSRSFFDPIYSGSKTLEDVNCDKKQSIQTPISLLEKNSAQIVQRIESLSANKENVFVTLANKLEKISGTSAKKQKANLPHLKISDTLQENKTPTGFSELLPIKVSSDSSSSPKIVIEEVFSYPNVVFDQDEDADISGQDDEEDSCIIADNESIKSEDTYSPHNIDPEISSSNEETYHEFARPRLINGFGEPFILYNNSQTAAFKVKMEVMDQEMCKKQEATEGQNNSLKLPDSGSVAENEPIISCRNISDKNSSEVENQNKKVSPSIPKKLIIDDLTESLKTNSEKYAGSSSKIHFSRKPRHKRKKVVSRRIISDTESSSDENTAHGQGRISELCDNRPKMQSSKVPRISPQIIRSKSATSLMTTKSEKLTSKEPVPSQDKEAPKENCVTYEVFHSRESKETKLKIIKRKVLSDTESSADNDDHHQEEQPLPREKGCKTENSSLAPVKLTIHIPKKSLTPLTSSTEVKQNNSENKHFTGSDMRNNLTIPQRKNITRGSNNIVINGDDSKDSIGFSGKEAVNTPVSLKKTPELTKNSHPTEKHNIESIRLNSREGSNFESIAGLRKLNSSPSPRLQTLNKFNRQASRENNKDTYLLSPIEGLEDKRKPSHLRLRLASLEASEDPKKSSNVCLAQTPLERSEDEKKLPYVKSALKRKIANEVDQVFAIQGKPKPNALKIGLKSNVSPPYKSPDIPKTVPEVQNVSSNNVVDSIIKAMSSAPPPKTRGVPFDKYSSRFLPSLDDQQSPNTTDNPLLSHSAPLFPSRPKAGPNPMTQLESVNSANKYFSREIQPETTKIYKSSTNITKSEKHDHIRNDEPTLPKHSSKGGNKSKIANVERRRGLALRFYQRSENHTNTENLLPSMTATSDLENKTENHSQENNQVPKEKEMEKSEQIQDSQSTVTLLSMPIISDLEECSSTNLETEICQSASKKLKISNDPKRAVGGDQVANKTPKLTDRPKHKRSTNLKSGNEHIQNIRDFKLKKRRKLEVGSLKVSIPLLLINKKIVKSLHNKSDSSKPSNKCLEGKSNDTKHFEHLEESQNRKQTSLKGRNTTKKDDNGGFSSSNEKTTTKSKFNRKVQEKNTTKLKMKRKMDLEKSEHYVSKKTCLSHTNDSNTLVNTHEVNISGLATENIENSRIPQISPTFHLKKVNAEESNTRQIQKLQNELVSIQHSNMPAAIPESVKESQQTHSIPQKPTSVKNSDGSTCLSNFLEEPLAFPVDPHFSLEQVMNPLEENSKEAIQVKESSMLIAPPENACESVNKLPTPQRRLSVLNTEILTTRTNVCLEEPDTRPTWYMSPEKPVERANIIPSEVIEVKTETSIVTQFIMEMSNATKKQHFIESFQHSAMSGNKEFVKLCDIIDCIKLDFKFKQDVVNGVQKLKSQDVIEMEILRAKNEFKHKFAERETSFKQSFKKFMEFFEQVDFKYPCLALIYRKLRQKVEAVSEGQKDLENNLITILKKLLMTKETQPVFTEEDMDLERDYGRVAKPFAKSEDGSEQNNNTDNPSKNKIEVQIKTEECDQPQKVGSVSSSKNNSQPDSVHISIPQANNIEKGPIRSYNKNATDSMNNSSFLVSSNITRNESSSPQSSNLKSCSPTEHVWSNQNSTSVSSSSTLNNQAQNTSAISNRVQTNSNQSKVGETSVFNSLNGNILGPSNVCSTNQYFTSEFNIRTSNQTFEIPQLSCNHQGNIVPTPQSNQLGLISPTANIYQQVRSSPETQPVSLPIHESPAQAHPNLIGNQVALQNLPYNFNTSQQCCKPTNALGLPRQNSVQKRNNTAQAVSQGKNQVRRLSAEGHVPVPRTSPGQLSSMHNFQGHMLGIGSTQELIPAPHSSPATQNLQENIPGKRFTQGQVPAKRTSPEQIPTMQNCQGYVQRIESNQRLNPVTQTSPGDMIAMQNFQGLIPGVGSTQMQASVSRTSVGQISSMQTFHQGHFSGIVANQELNAVAQTYPVGTQCFQGTIAGMRVIQEQNHVARTLAGHMQNFQLIEPSQIQATRNVSGQVPARNNFQYPIESMQRVISAIPSYPQQANCQGEFPALHNPPAYNTATMANQRLVSAAFSTSRRIANPALPTPQRLDLQVPTNQVPNPAIQNHAQNYPQLFSYLHHPSNLNQVSNQPYQNTTQANHLPTGANVNFYNNQYADQANTNYLNKSNTNVFVGNANSSIDHQLGAQQVSSLVQNGVPQINSNQQYLDSQTCLQNSNAIQQRRFNRSKSQNQQEPSAIRHHHSSTNDNNYSNQQRRHSAHGSTSNHQANQQQNLHHHNFNDPTLMNGSSSSNKANNHSSETSVANTPSTNPTPQIQEQTMKEHVEVESFDVSSLTVAEVEQALKKLEDSFDLPMIPYDNPDEVQGNQQTLSSESGNSRNHTVASFSPDLIQKILEEIDLVKDQIEIFRDYHVLNFDFKGNDVYHLMKYFRKTVEALDGSSGKTVELAFDGTFSTKDRKYSPDELHLLFSTLVAKRVIRKDNSNTNHMDEHSQNTNNTSILPQETLQVKLEGKPHDDSNEVIDILKEHFLMSWESGKYVSSSLDAIIGYKKKGSQYATRVIQELREALCKTRQDTSETIVLD